MEFITEIVTTYKVSVGRSAMESDEDLIILEEYYGSLSRTMLMLYMVVTAGTEWHLLVDPLGCTLMYRICHEVIQAKGTATYEEMGKSGVSFLHLPFRISSSVYLQDTHHHRKTSDVGCSSTATVIYACVH